MKSLARFSVRHRWYMLAAWIVLFVGVTASSQALGSAYSNNFTLPGTDSLKAQALLLQASPQLAGDSDRIVFHVNQGMVSDHAQSINATLQAISSLDHVASVVTPFCGTNPVCPGAAQISRDGRIAYATVNFDQPAFKLSLSAIKAVETRGELLRSSSLQVEFGGNAFGQLDAPRGNPGEIVGLVAAMIVLLLAFGSFISMLLPLGVALFALGIASGTTVLLGHVMAIADFTPILGSLIGLGVGIDYALFIVTRARQELLKGADVETAVSRAVNTSGRAVIFAGLTVCVALLGMFTLRLGYLNGVAAAASFTVLITMTASVTLLPSLIALAKRRLLSRSERRKLAQPHDDPSDSSTSWERWAGFVSRHPRSLTLAALVVMLATAAPFLSLHLGSSDQGQNPTSDTTRRAYDLLASGFGPGFNGPLLVVGETPGAADTASLHALQQRIAQDRDVAATGPVSPILGSHVSFFTVFPKSSPQDSATSQLIDRIRQVDVPAVSVTTHTPIYVGGITAIFDDFARILQGKLPGFIGIIVALGCLLLMVAFRSVLVPLVAAVMNLLAAGASFGLVVMVFQWGWGASLLQSGQGPIESFLPVIMIAILFGLSMDYQVFLVSRMHEEWVHTGDNELAITRGQGTTGRVITAAALIMIAVFSSFAFGGQRVIAEFGIGLGGAVLMDAFVIRTVLVPALMHYLGRANWWMPAWLERIVPHVAVEAEDEE